MENRNSTEREQKKYRQITGCLFCDAFYTHLRLLSERRNGVTLKPGKVYCLFSKKPIKLDARKRRSELPSICPRYDVPVRFAVYTLKKRAPAADTDAGNAARYWCAYTGNLDMITYNYLFSSGSYTNPDDKDGFLWNDGKQIHNLQAEDVVVREDGFTIEAWRWNGEYFISHIEYFDETGIKKMPKSKGDKTG